MTTTETAASALSARMTAVMGSLPDFGGDLHDVELNVTHDAAPRFWAYADVALSVFADGRRCETLAAEILDRFPDARIDRESGGAFAIVCPGDPSWSVYFSDSMCRRVQVGTRIETVPDPDAPMVEVETPVYEWRCADPLAEAVAS